MNKRLVLASLLLAALLAAGWVWRGSRINHWPIINDPPAGDGPIVAFGDSLTDGFAAPEGEGYVDVLSGLIGKQIVEAGFPGATSADGLQRVESVARLRPRVALVFLGGNDLIARRPKEQTRDDVRAIVRRLQQEGTLVVLVSVGGFAGIGSGLEKELRAVAREEGAVFVPGAMKGIIGHPALMSDNIHPNAEGYRVMATHIEELAGAWLRK